MLRCFSDVVKNWLRDKLYLMHSWCLSGTPVLGVILIIMSQILLVLVGPLWKKFMSMAVGNSSAASWQK
jgi:hypothetical protein